MEVEFEEEIELRKRVAWVEKTMGMRSGRRKERKEW